MITPIDDIVLIVILVFHLPREGSMIDSCLYLLALDPREYNILAHGIRAICTTYFFRLRKISVPS